MTERPEQLPPWVAGFEHRMHELDPELSEAQIATVARYGKKETFEDGDMLWRPGDRHAGWFLVLSGHLEIVDQHEDGERVIITHGRGHYGGEIVTMAGQGAVVGGRAKGRTTVLAVDTQSLRQMLALESELGEILITSFIVRRMRMLAERQGAITLYGEGAESHTARLRTFLSRHGVPHTHVEGDALAQAKVAANDLPIVRIGDKQLVKPSVRRLAEDLGVAGQLADEKPYDLIVIGAGPAGLAAAVYGASEGLSVLVVEALAPGGQAGTSSRIENYLGFPTGISGQGLAGRAFLQATKFGAEIAFARQVTALECAAPHRLVVDRDDTVRGHHVVIATGALYREPPVEDLDRFQDGGVHYGASFLEAQLCRGQDIAIIGGGNSAGQAAIYLADHARSVTICIRGDSLARTMSRYLIDRIDRSENISVLPDTEVTCVHGETKLEAVTLRNRRDGSSGQRQITHLFIFIGAVPANQFLPSCVHRDDNGFVVTGDQLEDTTLEACGWTADRRPFHLETTCAGVFAVGDIRAGSMKRVASAVGEGSVCVQYVHRLMAQHKTRAA